MSRYIDADKIPWTDLNDNLNSNIKVLVTFAEKVNRMPTADVVEVVRCKDCKYATYDKSIDRYDCRNWGSDGDEYTEADDFCSYGERA